MRQAIGGTRGCAATPGGLANVARGVARDAAREATLSGR